ncbi:MAG TPA: GntR family transcriptional regulator [Pseudonocardiaceae bacterium]|nr:GntR family transcriptional regulator [Pseudonocardiaceae bacterium]
MTLLQSDNPEPLWLRAAETIRDQVSEGALRPGSRLPPERDLCRRLDISRVTLRRALLQLVDDGVLKPSHGRGWYVASDERKDWPNSLESFSETAARMGLIATSVVLRADTAMATLDEAEALGVAPGALLFHLERVRMLDEVPIAIDRSIVPADLAPGLVDVDFRTESLYSALATAGLVLANAETTIEAREADAAIAEHLRVAVGKPILVMHQTVLNPADKPLFASTISYVGDRYRLRTSFARS